MRHFTEPISFGEGNNEGPHRASNNRPDPSLQEGLSAVGGGWLSVGTDSSAGPELMALTQDGPGCLH